MDAEDFVAVEADRKLIAVLQLTYFLETLACTVGAQHQERIRAVVKLG